MTDVELHRGNGVAVVLDEERRMLLKDQLNPDLTDGELALFAEVCQRVSLDPFARQIYAVKRYDRRQGRAVMTIQTSIDGFRLVAERTGRYAGQRGPFWCGPDGEWLVDKRGKPRPWLAKEPPTAALVEALKRGFDEPLPAIARFDAYAQRNKDGKLTNLWASMGDLMIGKCAEALALRRAFPQELSGLYTAEEMAQADNPPPGPSLPAIEESPYVSAANVERLQEQCDELGIDIADVVRKATGDRTDDPAQILKTEIAQVRDAKVAIAEEVEELRAEAADMAEDASHEGTESADPMTEPF